MWTKKLCISLNHFHTWRNKEMMDTSWHIHYCIHGSFSATTSNWPHKKKPRSRSPRPLRIWGFKNYCPHWRWPINPISPVHRVSHETLVTSSKALIRSRSCLFSASNLVMPCSKSWVISMIFLSKSKPQRKLQVLQNAPLGQISPMSMSSILAKISWDPATVVPCSSRQISPSWPCNFPRVLKPELLRVVSRWSKKDEQDVKTCQANLSSACKITGQPWQHRAFCHLCCCLQDFGLMLEASTCTQATSPRHRVMLECRMRMTQSMTAPSSITSWSFLVRAWSKK